MVSVLWNGVRRPRYPPEPAGAWLASAWGGPRVHPGWGAACTGSTLPELLRVPSVTGGGGRSVSQPRTPIHGFVTHGHPLRCV